MAGAGDANGDGRSDVVVRAGAAKATTVSLAAKAWRWVWVRTPRSVKARRVQVRFVASDVAGNRTVLTRVIGKAVVRR